MFYIKLIWYNVTVAQLKWRFFSFLEWTNPGVDD